MGWLVTIHVVFSVLDLAINSAAGAAAAATGAHVEGAPITTLVVQTGAWAGLLKSGVLNFSVLIAMTTQNVFVFVITIFLGSSFGASELVTLAVCQSILGRSPIASIIAIGWDALTGYTFARVAHNHGYDVCHYKSAAAAGAVYGSLVWFVRLPITILMQARSNNQDYITSGFSNNF
ncbi:hypothetical protein GMORB2_3520 [Geosmithia morbida]|uniref:Uncharacterized protein n=1 Tax=Geosmithia morbida TaxID=1094350 RepID=A0A9P4YNS4_9HYPO|nr:uncharacterized protein GMORB2_3520 [Geosmithia morbida]KAF4119832.1 hypothetical protein GMORB2_3520 [Geosmithia morbida]